MRRSSGIIRHFRRLLALSCSYETHDCHRTDFHETSYIIILLIFFNPFRFELKSEKITLYMNNYSQAQTFSATLFYKRGILFCLRSTRWGRKLSLYIPIGKVYSLHEYEFKKRDFGAWKIVNFEYRFLRNIYFKSPPLGFLDDDRL
jgi:hypothetical protein